MVAIRAAFITASALLTGTDTSRPSSGDDFAILFTQFSWVIRRPISIFHPDGDPRKESATSPVNVVRTFVPVVVSIHCTGAVLRLSLQLNETDNMITGFDTVLSP